MTTKSIFHSKTAAFGFLTALAGAGAYFFPEVETILTEHAPGILVILGLISVILRRVTNGSVQLFPLLLVGLFLALPSCKQFVPAYDVTNSSIVPIAPGETRRVPSDDVVPILKVPVPDKFGGGSIDIPINPVK